jgi:hypothetical protein
LSKIECKKIKKEKHFSYFLSNPPFNMSSTTTSSAPDMSAFAILSAIGQAAIEEREALGSDPHEELARLTENLEEKWYAAGGGTLRTPSLGCTSTTHYLGAMLEEIQERRKELGMEEYSPPAYGLAHSYPRVVRDIISPSELLASMPGVSISKEARTPFGKQATEPAVSDNTIETMRAEYIAPAKAAPTSSFESPRPSRFGYLPPPPPLTRTSGFSNAAPPLPSCPSEDAAMDNLRALRAELQLQQDDLYKDAVTDEEIKAKDEDYDEIQQKISAIEQCMLAFGAIFRHR